MSDRLTVYCDDAAHARGKVATVATFARVDGRWTEQAVATLDPGHGTYTMRCRLCRVEVRVSGVKWLPRLDALAEADVSRVSLLALARIVGGR